MAAAPIPIPFSQRLRDLRMKAVPVLLFAGTVVITAMIWRDAVAPAMLVGEVSGAKASINSPTAAAILKLHADRLSMVKAGDVIAELAPTTARQPLDLLQADLSILRMKADAQAAKEAQDRITLDYEKLRLDWMSAKVELVFAEAKVRKTQMELDAARALVDAPDNAQRFVQQAQLAKDSADDEAKVRKELVETLGRRVEELRSTVPAGSSSGTETLNKTLATLESRLREIAETQSTITLRAPIDGIITTVFHRKGENVKQGEPLVLITAVQPDSIVGYLRQPFPLEPGVGQEVEVRSHSRGHTLGTAKIIRVGAHFEPIMNAALHPSATPEVGLPVEVSLPPNLRLRPGELVGLVIKPTSDR